jgi:hypothetical protein
MKKSSPGIAEPRPKTRKAAVKRPTPRPALPDHIAAYGKEHQDFFLGTLREVGTHGNAHYMMDTYMGLDPKNVKEALVATHITILHGIFLDSAARMRQSSFLPEAEFSKKLCLEISPLLVDHLQTLNTFQNSQSNNISIGTVSVENGQANIGCMTNACAVTTEEALPDKENAEEVLLPKRRAKRRNPG